MAKLASFLERLAEKAAAKEQAAGREGEPLEGSSLYAKRRYWDERYEDGVVGHTADKGELSNEWFVGYDALRDLISRHLPRKEGVLILGCGLSLLGEDMCADGYERVTAVDYSATAIERMRQQQGARERPSGVASVEYLEMDVTRLDMADGSADSLLDKATLDTLLNLDDGGRAGRAMAAEAARVLRPGGRLLCVSYGEPADRLPVFGLQPGHAAGQAPAPGAQWRLAEVAQVAKNRASFWAYALDRL